MCALVGLYLKERKREIYPAVFGNSHGLTFQVFQLVSPLKFSTAVLNPLSISVLQSTATYPAHLILIFSV